MSNDEKLIELGDLTTEITKLANMLVERDQRIDQLAEIAQELMRNASGTTGVKGLLYVSEVDFARLATALADWYRDRTDKERQYEMYDMVSDSLPGDSTQTQAEPHCR